VPLTRVRAPTRERLSGSGTPTGNILDTVNRSWHRAIRSGHAALTLRQGIAMRTFWLGLSRGLFSLIVLLLLAACGGGGNGGGARSWINIHEPENGYSTSSAETNVQGNLANADGSYPTGRVTWSNGSSSGTTPVICGFLCCLIRCAGSFEVEVPLNLGTNTITVSYEGASASIRVTRFLVFTISGRVAVQGTGVGLTFPEVTVTRMDAAGSSWFETKPDQSGNYVFVGLKAGSYIISPRLASSCLHRV